MGPASDRQETRATMSDAGPWIFTPLAVLLLAGMAALGTVYVNNRQTAERVPVRPVRCRTSRGDWRVRQRPSMPASACAT